MTRFSSFVMGRGALFAPDTFAAMLMAILPARSPAAGRSALPVCPPSLFDVIAAEAEAKPGSAHPSATGMRAENFKFNQALGLA